MTGDCHAVDSWLTGDWPDCVWQLRQVIGMWLTARWRMENGLLANDERKVKRFFILLKKDKIISALNKSLCTEQKVSSIRIMDQKELGNK